MSFTHWTNLDQWINIDEIEIKKNLLINETHLIAPTLTALCLCALLRISTLGINERGISRAIRAGIVKAGADATKTSVTKGILAAVYIHLKFSTNRALAKEVFTTVIA